MLSLLYLLSKCLRCTEKDIRKRVYENQWLKEKYHQDEWVWSFVLRRHNFHSFTEILKLTLINDELTFLIRGY